MLGNPPTFKELETKLRTDDPERVLEELRRAAEEGDDWLQALFGAYRIVGNLTSAQALYAANSDRIEANPVLAYEMALVSSGMSIPAFADYILKCIIKWPNDKHFMALFLNYQAIYFPHELMCSKEAEPHSPSRIALIQDLAVQSLMYGSFGKFVQMADLVVQAYLDQEWTAYLNMATMRTRLIEFASIKLNDSQEHLSRASEEEKLFFAIIYARDSKLEHARRYIEAINSKSLYWTDRFLTVIVLNKIRSARNSRELILAYCESRKPTPYGWQLCWSIAADSGDSTLLKYLDDLASR